MAGLEKIPLILAPTPLHRLDNLSKELGLDLWIKRDDLTGFGFGGNKGRKLEYIMADALRSSAEVLVTCGSSQSNFVRQLGAACSMLGLSCIAAVMDLPYEYEKPSGTRLAGGCGNVLLDQILGVQLQRHEDATWEELFARAETIAREQERKGKRVYRVPIGGSSALGAYAFWRAAEEIPHDFDTVVVATSSGSTQTGLASGFRRRNVRVLGIACDPEPEIAEDFSDLSAELAKFTGEPPLQADEFNIDFNHVGPGYGVPSKVGLAAIRRMARAEGIFLDPVYTGKAFAGLLSLAKKGELDGRVLFWHTGGTPALFALPEGIL